MTVASDAQITRLRQRPHRTTIHLSVYEPNTALAARINMSGIARGERVIDITVLGGDFNSVERGMTCYIGTTPNGQDVDRVRAISATATSLTIAENDFNLRNGMYLTVVWYYEPWAVFPRIVLSGDHIPIFYKDYDLTYSNQNQFHDPVPHMGPNHAAFLETTPSGSFTNVWYTSSGTFDPTDDSTPTGYAWIFEGGSPTASFVPDPGYIDYTGAGHFLTSLEVTSNFGKTFTGRRHVSIYTRPDLGPARPIVAWGMSSFEGARDNGGYSMRMWIREEAGYSRIVDGALIVIFTEDGQGALDGVIGGNAENRSEILFNGYIEDESISINPVTNRLEFRVLSITGRMKSLAGFSASYESKKSAQTSTWTDMTNMTVDKAMIGFLRWQSTILAIADYQPTGNDLDVQFMDFERSSVYDALNNLLASSLVATAVADRQGKIWTEIDANVRSTGSARNINTAISITRQDWRSALDIEVAHEPNLSYLEMGGIAYSGPATGTNDPFLAGAPGDAPAYFGGLERVSGLVIESQTQLNELVGLAWARANQEYPELIIPMAGDYRILDIAPQERVIVSLVEDDTWRGYVWDEKSFIPSSIQYAYQAADQVLLQEVTLSNETDGPPGETVEIPVDPPFPEFILPEINLPPLIIPPPLPPVPIDPAPGSGDLVYVAAARQLTRARNFFDDTPTWEDITPSQTGANSVTGSYRLFELDTADPQNSAWLLSEQGVVNPGIPAPNLYRVTNLDSASPTFSLVLNGPDILTLLGAGNYQLTVYSISQSPLRPQIIFVQGASQAGGVPCAFMLRSDDYGATWKKLEHWNYSRAQASFNIVMASEHVFADAYTVPGESGGVQLALWSAVLGEPSSWITLYNAADVENWHIPYQGNPADLAMYISTSHGVAKRLRYSENRLTNTADITPEYLGKKWAVRRTENPFGQNYKQIETHPTNRLYVAALLQENDAEPNDKGTIYFTSSSGPLGLVQTYDFGAASNIKVTGLKWHRTNIDVLYARGWTITTRILGTQDGGLTWINKYDSWYVQILGGSPAAHVDPFTVQPVWTV